MFSLFDPTVGEAGRDRTDTVVVPIGAVEDHSRHLALDSDNFIIWSICEEAAQRADRNILLVRRRGAGPGAGGHSAGPGSSQSDTAGSNVLTGRFGHYFKFGAGPASRSRLSAGSWQNSSKLSSSVLGPLRDLGCLPEAGRIPPNSPSISQPSARVWKRSCPVSFMPFPT